MNKDLAKLLGAAGAVVLCAVAVGAAACAIPAEVRMHSNVAENGLVEFAQLGVLALAAAAYAVRGAVFRDFTRASYLCALALLAMVVRELDGPLDVALWHGSWAAVDAAVLAAFVAVFLARRQDSMRDLSGFVSSRRFPLLAAGLVAAVVFAQIVGWKGIWNGLFDAEIWHGAADGRLLPDGKLPPDLDIPRHVKNTVEESVELGSYLMLLVSALLPSGRSDRAAG
ncbi:MAG: hypothetical protein IJ678_01320 [Kiritimatiellae bacterium]|nr:hypothetical protein [Kiritimatiellia bacterium]